MTGERRRDGLREALQIRGTRRRSPYGVQPPRSSRSSTVPSGAGASAVTRPGTVCARRPAGLASASWRSRTAPVRSPTRSVPSNGPPAEPRTVTGPGQGGVRSPRCRAHRSRQGEPSASSASAGRSRGSAPSPSAESSTNALSAGPCSRQSDCPARIQAARSPPWSSAAFSPGREGTSGPSRVPGSPAAAEPVTYAVVTSSGSAVQTATGSERSGSGPGGSGAAGPAGSVSPSRSTTATRRSVRRSAAGAGVPLRASTTRRTRPTPASSAMRSVSAAGSAAACRSVRRRTARPAGRASLVARACTRSPGDLATTPRRSAIVQVAPRALCPASGTSTRAVRRRGRPARGPCLANQPSSAVLPLPGAPVTRQSRGASGSVSQPSSAVASASVPVAGRRPSHAGDGVADGMGTPHGQTRCGRLTSTTLVGAGPGDRPVGGGGLAGASAKVPGRLGDRGRRPPRGPGAGLAGPGRRPPPSRVRIGRGSRGTPRRRQGHRPRRPAGVRRSSR